MKDIDLSSPYCSEPISIILIIFTISNLGRNFRLRRSLERFSYRRQIEIKDEKLKGITQAYTEGILIFSLSKNILFYNLQVTQLLKCEENQLEETIKSLKYCEGKKLTTTPRSNGIIDDIYYLLDKNESGDNNLGVNLLENLILE